jgi:hypothetical protein
MGFNPFHKRVRRAGDYVLVGLAFVIVVALLAWAALPR